MVVALQECIQVVSHELDGCLVIPLHLHLQVDQPCLQAVKTRVAVLLQQVPHWVEILVHQIPARCVCVCVRACTCGVCVFS